MVHRDGDGWIECNCGGKHWGLNGAAGLLLVRGGAILMQHRAPWVHNGDTWGIPGGARDSHESVIEAAIREAHEANDESKEVAWIAFDEVINKNLHPSFANTWPTLLAKLKAL